MGEQQRGDVEAAATWLRHAEVAAERTRPRPSARANLANARAMVLAGSGDLAGAEAAFRDGLVECEADECQRTRSTLLLNLAQLVERNADYEQSAQLHREALHHLAAVFGEDSSATIRARLQLTEALVSTGRVEEADEQLEVVSALLERWSSPDEEVLVMKDLLAMRTHADRGDLDGALAIGRGRLETMADDPSPPTIVDAGFLQTHANYLDEGGHHAEAVQFYDRALAIAEDVAPGSLEAAGIRLSRGYTLGVLGRLDEAIEDARQARAMMVALGAGEHPFVAITLRNEADAERMAGRPDRARALDDRARELENRR